MRLDLYPLEKETDDKLLIRTKEECAELILAASKCIIAASKCLRFGLVNHHPDRETFNLEELVDGQKEIESEMKDVDLCFAEIKRRMKRK